MPDTTPHTPGTFCWVELATSDPTAAKAFYADLLGWSYEDNPMGPDEVYSMIRRDGQDVGGLYKLMAQQTSHGVPPHWLPFVAVEDANATAEKVTSLGGSVVVPPMNVMDHGRMAVIRDPGGAVLSIWQAKSHVGAGITEGPGTHCWSEVNTRHFDLCQAFYTGLFNWQSSPIPMDETRYLMFMNGGQPVGGLLEMNQMWEGIPSHWMIYFAVQDTDATAAKVTGQGGSVKVPPFDTPYGRMMVLADPQGAVVSVIRLEAAASA